MYATVSVLLVSLLAPAPALESKLDTKFVQVAPVPKGKAHLERSPGQTRAVVLIHGFHVHPFSDTNIARANFQDWQTNPKSRLVKALAIDSDVFAFAYGQTAAVEEIACCSGLAANVTALRKLGFSQIVLVGHS